MQATEAAFYDGLTAGRHPVRLRLSEDRQALEISGDTLPGVLRWQLMDLRAPRDHADRDRLTLMRHEPGDDEVQRHEARLVIDDPALIAWLHRTRPNLFRHDLAQGTWRKVGYYAGGALAATALLLFVIIPALAGTLARIIPVEREIAFGKTVLAQMEYMLGGAGIGSLTCSNPDGVKALQTMANRLTEGQPMHYSLDIRVFDHPTLNAFAAPGGQIVILRGLLDAASHPDQVAGVLAHEIGHVEHRDVTRNALRTAGSAGLLSMLLGDVSGGALIALVGDHVMNASYTRDAEAEADGYGLAMLDAAQVDAGGLASFFDIVTERAHGLEVPELFASHPATPGRADRARALAERQAGTTPVLTSAEWDALKRICDKAADPAGEDI
ncbi:M48 family metallopeptidase [Tropicibacter sp. S64]|uniref:M48 family metallopeptidase n=1 Tax=Tropicibacter sp. S64 TaxID=3415122 RepID=UPI003C7E3767